VVAVVIGLCTFTMVTIGIMLGRALGVIIGRRAEIAGGVILILVGAAILHEHLSGAA
jgi:putative Mn2+ efflux pump MntP